MHACMHVHVTFVIHLLVYAVNVHPVCLHVCVHKPFWHTEDTLCSISAACLNSLRVCANRHEHTLGTSSAMRLRTLLGQVAN